LRAPKYGRVFKNVECLTPILYFWFPQGTKLTVESKALKEGIPATVNQHAKVRSVLASASTIAAKTPKDAAFRCDEHGMFIDYSFCVPSESKEIRSASLVESCMRGHWDFKTSNA